MTTKKRPHRRYTETVVGTLEFQGAEYLRYQLADRFEEHPPSAWSTDLLIAAIAVIDAHLGIHAGTAPVLQLLRRGDRDG